MKDLKPLMNGLENLPAIPGFFSPGMIELKGRRTPEQLLMLARYPLIDLSEKYEAVFVKKPVFILEENLILPVSNFQFPASNVENLQTTVLRVDKKSGTVPPVVTVVESCGDEQLDKAAMIALLFPAVFNERVKGIIRVEWQQNKAAK